MGVVLEEPSVSCAEGLLGTKDCKGLQMAVTMSEERFKSLALLGGAAFFSVISAFPIPAPSHKITGVLPTKSLPAEASLNVISRNNLIALSLVGFV